jgi:hypothetical protein
MDVQSVSFFTANSMDLQSVSFFTANSRTSRVFRRIPFHRQRYGRGGCMTCMVYPFSPPVVLTYRLYPFPQPAEWTCRVCPFPPSSVWKCMVCPNRMNVLGVTIFTVRIMDVQCAGCMSFHRQQYERAGCVPFYCPQYGRAGCTPFLNAGISDCPASCQFGTGMNKNAHAGTSPVPEEGDPVRYRTELHDAGMPMLCLQSSPSGNISSTMWRNSNG